MDRVAVVAGLGGSGRRWSRNEKTKNRKKKTEKQKNQFTVLIKKTGNVTENKKARKSPTNENLTIENSDQARGNGAWESRESVL